jgi:hypothetical protein
MLIDARHRVGARKTTSAHDVLAAVCGPTVTKLPGRRFSWSLGAASLAAKFCHKILRIETSMVELSPQVVKACGDGSNCHRATAA